MERRLQFNSVVLILDRNDCFNLVEFYKFMQKQYNKDAVFNNGYNEEKLESLLNKIKIEIVPALRHHDRMQKMINNT